MLLRGATVFIILVAASAAIPHAERVAVAPERTALSTFPFVIDEWRGQADPPLSDDVLAILDADDYLMRRYHAPGQAAALYIGYWDDGRYALMHLPVICLPGAGWREVSTQKRRIGVSDKSGTETAVEVNRYVVEKGDQRLLVLYWYDKHGHVIENEYQRKFFRLADALRLHGDHTAIVRVVTTINGSTRAAEMHAEQTAVEFVEQIFPLLSDYIPS